MSAETDKAVMQLLLKVEEKKKEIKAASKKANWATNLSFGYNPDSAADRVNIMTVKDEAKLVEIYTFLLAKEEHWEQANEELGLKVAPSWLGYPIADWKKDVLTRAGQVGLDQKKRDLDALDKRVNGLVSQEQRREMELAALTAELS